MAVRMYSRSGGYSENYHLQRLVPGDALYCRQAHASLNEMCNSGMPQRVAHDLTWVQPRFPDNAAKRLLLSIPRAPFVISERETTIPGPVPRHRGKPASTRRGEP
jgi:hypothetical protein